MLKKRIIQNLKKLGARTQDDVLIFDPEVLGFDLKNKGLKVWELLPDEEEFFINPTMPMSTRDVRQVGAGQYWIDLETGDRFVDTDSVCWRVTLDQRLYHLLRIAMEVLEC